MIIGHQELIDDFKRLASQNELSHSYLFYGSPRVGKKLFALCLANFLETGNFSDEPRVLQDALLISPNERGIIGIDEIRRIKNFLSQKPIISPKRTMVVDEAENMTDEAQNALLKIAEEPPASSLLVIISSDSEKLWLTLRSRLQRIYFPAVPLALVEKWLNRNFSLEEAEAHSLAHFSRGQPGLAWRFLKDEKFRSLYQIVGTFLKSNFWARRNVIRMLLEDDKFNINEFLEVLSIALANGKLTPDKFNLWHALLRLRLQTDYLNLNPRLQLENLITNN